ncbi:MAG: FkbM family methyltransferase [Candidatus Acidiferrum sp.]
MRDKRNADSVARILNSAGYFRGKARLADALGRLASYWKHGCGTFSLDGGRAISIDLNDRVQRLMWGGAYEPHVRNCLVAILHPGDTFVDIGAHIGFFSLLAASLVGNTGKVYAFEANANVFQKLQANASEYPWLAASLRAIWSESGQVAFSDPQQPGETGWGKLTAIRNEGHVVSVEAITLDEWHMSVGTPGIRAMKIDAEGSEPFILDGARRLIARTRPIMIIELNDQLLREVKRSKEAVLARLRDDGYLVFPIGSDRSKNLANASNLLSPEVLCLPSERIAESRNMLSRLGIEA